MNCITSTRLLLLYVFLTVPTLANTKGCYSIYALSSDNNILSNHLAGQGRSNSHMKAKEESAPATSAIFLWSADFIIFGHKTLFLYSLIIMMGFFLHSLWVTDICIAGQVEKLGLKISLLPTPKGPCERMGCMIPSAYGR